MGIFSGRDAEKSSSSTSSTLRTSDRGPSGTVRNEPTTALARGESLRIDKPSNQNPEVTVTSHSKGTDAKFTLNALVLYRNGQQVYLGSKEHSDLNETNEKAVRHHGERMLGLSDDEKITVKWDQAIEAVAISAHAMSDSDSDQDSGMSRDTTMGQPSAMSQSSTQHQSGNHAWGLNDLSVRFACDDQIVEITPQATGADPNSTSMLVGRIDFNNDGSVTIKNQEQYAAPNSQRRMSFVDGDVRMDSGPESRIG